MDEQDSLCFPVSSGKVLTLRKVSSINNIAFHDSVKRFHRFLQLYLAIMLIMTNLLSNKRDVTDCECDNPERKKNNPVSVDGIKKITASFPSPRLNKVFSAVDLVDSRTF